VLADAYSRSEFERVESRSDGSVKQIVKLGYAPLFTLHGTEVTADSLRSVALSPFYS